MNQDLIFRLLVKALDTSDLDKLKKKLDDNKKSADNLGGGFAKAGNLLKGLFTAYILKQGVDFGRNIIDLADGLHDLSQKTGIGVDALSGYQEAAKQAGLSTEGLSTGLKFFSKAIAEAQAGSAQMVSAFKNLGISAQDLKSKSPDQLMSKLADNFTKLQDGPAKAANAMKIFGKSGTDMIPFLNQGSKTLKEFSLGLGDDFAARADHFNDSISALGSSVKRELVQGFQILLPHMQDILDSFKKMPSFATEIKDTFKNLGQTLRETTYVFVHLGMAAIDTADSVITAFRALKEWNKWAKKGSGDNAEQMIVDLAGRSNKRQAAIDSFDKGIFARNSEGQIPPPSSNKDKKTVSTEGIGGGELDKVKQFIALRQQENDQLKESLGDYQLTALELKKVLEVRKLDKEVLKESNGLTKEQKEKLKGATEQIKAQRLALIELDYQQSRTFSYGAKKAFQDYVESASNAAKNAQEFFGKAFQGMEDGLTDFVKTGAFSFQKFADMIIEEIIRITIRQQVLAPIMGGIGSLFGGGATGTGSGYTGGDVGGGATTIASANGNVLSRQGVMSLHKYAAGGVARSPQMALFGEAGPEAFVPLPDGRRIPVAMKGGGGGCNVQVVVNMGDGSANGKSANEQGKQIGNVVVNLVRSELIKQKRPGGLIAG